MSSPAGDARDNPVKPPDRLGPTTFRDLVLAAVAGALLEALGIATLNLVGTAVPITPWSLPGILVVLGVAAAYYARLLEARVRQSRADVRPEEGVRALVMGKVMLFGGALLLGAHVVYVAEFLPRFSVPAPQQRVERGLAAAVASVVFAVGGWLLERSCRVDAGGDDEDDPADGVRGHVL